MIVIGLFMEKVRPQSDDPLPQYMGMCMWQALVKTVLSYLEYLLKLRNGIVSLCAIVESRLGANLFVG